MNDENLTLLDSFGSGLAEVSSLPRQVFSQMGNYESLDCWRVTHSADVSSE
jgi:hypothetical protein